MRTRFICSVDNEAVLKALFKIKDNELTFAKAIAVAVKTEEAAKFAKAIAVAVETEEAAKFAKETVYGTSITLSSSFNKVQGSRKQSPGLAIGKKQIFPREHALGVVRVTTSRKTAPFKKLFVIFAKR